MPNKYDVFISYSTEDTEQAEYICRILQNNGLTTWFAPRDIAPGDFMQMIPAAIDSCGAFVLVLTHSAQASKWVNKEVKCAVDKGKTIFPVAIEQFDMDDKFNFVLSEYTRYEAYAREEAVLGKLIRDLNAILEKDPQAEQPVLAGTELPPKWKNTREDIPKAIPKDIPKDIPKAIPKETPENISQPKSGPKPWLIPVILAAVLLVGAVVCFVVFSDQGEITSGTYVIWNPSYGVAMSDDVTKKHYLAGKRVEHSGQRLRDYPDDCVWQIDFFSDGTFTISRNGQNLGMVPGYNGVGLGGEHTADRWILTEAGDGLYYIRNVEENSYLEWFDTKDNWSVYDQVKDENRDMFLLRLSKAA
jgi:hypothetical protein